MFSIMTVNFSFTEYVWMGCYTTLFTEKEKVFNVLVNER